MMNLTITDLDFGLTSEGNYDGYELRRASRAILFDAQNRIAILSVENGNYHKLPGGGIDEGESIELALEREVLEEVGAKICIGNKMGVITEYREDFKQVQESHFYKCTTIGEIDMPTFTESEKANGFSLMWMSLEEAYHLMKADVPENYVGKFINKRDVMALENYLRRYDHETNDPLKTN